MSKKHSSVYFTLPYVLPLVALCALPALACASELSLGTHVEKRELQNPKSDFTLADKTVCAQIAVTPSVAGNVTFVWTRDGKQYGAFTSPTKESPRFRVHSCVTAHPGKWTVVVANDKNDLLGNKTFSVAAVNEPSQTKAEPHDQAKTEQHVDTVAKAVSPQTTEAKEEAKAVEVPTTVPSFPEPKAVAEPTEKLNPVHDDAKPADKAADKVLESIKPAAPEVTPETPAADHGAHHHDSKPAVLVTAPEMPVDTAEKKAEKEVAPTVSPAA